MTLLEEMRNLDIGDPGRWSLRVSLVLACALLVAIALLGLRLRVFGQFVPQLEAAKSEAVRLEQRLETARHDALAMRALGEQVSQAEARLKDSGAWIPSRAEELDLPVSLAAGQDGGPVQSVRSWEAPEDFSRRLRHAGAELDLSGSYAELIAYLNFALDSGQLRELVELGIQSQEPEYPGLLRASVRLVAYFGGPDAARLLRTKPQNRSVLQAAKSARAPASLVSPFGDPPAAAASAIETPQENPQAAPGMRGFIRVGNRRYELVEDPDGKFRLRSEG